MISWLKIGGKENPSLEKELSSRVQAKRDAKLFSFDNQEYVRLVDLSLSKKDFKVSPRKLELLRRLCQIYHVDLVSGCITSHRPVIGKIIVTAKKIAFGALRPFLEKSMRQQRDFNAAVIALLAEIANEEKDLKQP